MAKKEEIAAVRKYLKNGDLSGFSESQIAKFCDDAVRDAARSSIKDAIGIANSLIEKPGRPGGPIEMVAYRCHGRLNHMAGNHKAALDSYLQARSLHRRQPVDRARIDRALTDVHMYLGDLKSAGKFAKSALTTFRRLGANRDIAMTQVNYAHLLHRQDRHKDAESAYRDALKFFDKTKDPLPYARCAYNLANVLTQQFEMEEAEHLYHEAHGIYTESGFELDANDARYGLAWLKMLTGDLHIALTELGVCQDAYRRGGDKRGEALCTLDRAEVFLGLNMYEDSLNASKLSERKFGSLGLEYETSKAQFFGAQSALALGRVREAANLADKAMTGFKKQRNVGFQAAVKLLLASMESDENGSRSRYLRSARKLYSRCQLPLWEAVCDLHATTGSRGTKAALDRLESNKAAHIVPHLYAGWQTALGDYLMGRGENNLAIEAWTRAANRLDSVRSKLPPVELRTEYGKAVSSPHVRLIDSTLEVDPIASAAWSERYKTAGPWMPATNLSKTSKARDAIQSSLEKLAEQVSSVARLSGAGSERTMSPTASGRRVRILQRQIRDQLALWEKPGSVEPSSINHLESQLLQESHHQPILLFHSGRHDLAVFVICNGTSRTVVIKDGVRRLTDAMRRWRFLLESEIMSERLGGNPNLGTESSYFSDLGEWLWKPLDVPVTEDTIVIIPEGELFNLPWQAIEIDGRPLGDRHRFVISPSLRHHMAARKIRTKSNRFEVFRGKADNLPEIDGEIEELSDRIGSDLIAHRPAMRSDWPNRGNARVWHYAGHAHLRSDNPFYSRLDMEDGPIFAADFRLRDTKVNLVTLSACRTGELVSVPGEESTGFVRSFLEMGARNVIASHWPVSDKSTALWMKSFYHRYTSGQSILDSMRSAAITVRESFPFAYHWAAFSVFGAGS